MNLFNVWMKSIAVIISIAAIVFFSYMRKRYKDQREARITVLLRKVKPIMGTEVGARDVLADRAQNRKTLETAKCILDEILRLNHNHLMALHYYAIYHLKTRNLGEAEKCWIKALQFDTNNASILIRLGQLSKYKGDIHGSISYFNNVEKKSLQNS